MGLLGFLLLLAPRLAAAVCECGFSARGSHDGDGPWLFTDVLESDFTRAQDISADRDWVRQQFNVSAEAGRGRYGKSFSLDNVLSQARTKLGEETSASQGARALELRVDGVLRNRAVAVAELDSARLDMHWGSYRAGMKLTAVHGTCAAFFWYFNDTQEIDMEFLSQSYDADKHVYPVNLVVQSQKSRAAGYDASKTATFRRVNLGFDPTAGFHEYRFDYLPGRVLFYADSAKLAELAGDEMPTAGGHLILQHWSNGDPKWSGGPPTQDALMMVSYVKAYFNSSDSTDGSRWAKRCEDSHGAAVCNIADVTAANASTGGRFLTGGGDGGGSRKDGEADSGCAAVGGSRGSRLAAVSMAMLGVLVMGIGRDCLQGSSS